MVESGCRTLWLLCILDLAEQLLGRREGRIVRLSASCRRRSDRRGAWKSLLDAQWTLRTVDLTWRLQCLRTFKTQCWHAEWINSLHWQGGQIDAFDQLEVFEVSARSGLRRKGHRVVVLAASCGRTALPHCRMAHHRPGCRGRSKVMDGVQIDEGHCSLGEQFEGSVRNRLRCCVKSSRDV